MQVNIDVSPNISHTVQLLQSTEAQAQRAIVRTLNKVARWLKVNVSRETAKELNIKVGLVRRSLVVVRAKRGRASSSVALPNKNGVINVIDLGAPKKNSRGIRVARKQYDSAFLATMPQGHRGVFWRKDEGRLPIRELKVVITGRMSKIMERLSEGPVRREFDKIFERELNFILRHEKR